MWTVERQSGGIPGPAHHRSNRKKVSSRNESQGQDCRSQRCGNPFLDATYPPIAREELIWTSLDCSSHNLITQANYEYLRDSYLRYASLMGVKPACDPDGTLGVRIAKLYNAMVTLIGPEMNVNLEEDRGRLYFNLWKMHRWGNLSLYYFPIRFTQGLNPRLRRIVLSFYHELIKSNWISTINYSDDACWAVEMLLEMDPSDYDDPAEWRRSRRRLKSYQEEGRIYRALEKVESTSFYKDLSRAIDAYPCSDDNERTLVDLLRQGMQFVNPAYPLLSYEYDPYYSEDADFPPMSLCQQIHLVYDIDGMVEMQMVDIYNCNSQETYDLLPITTFKVTPETDRVFVLEDDYPERFFIWADRFLKFVTNTL